jgi:hypothetical protein
MSHSIAQSGSSHGPQGLTDPSLTAEVDSNNNLKLNSVSFDGGPRELTLLGASSDIWLQFVWGFAQAARFLMDIRRKTSLDERYRNLF